MKDMKKILIGLLTLYVKSQRSSHMDGEIAVEIRVIQDREKKKDAILKCESVYILRSLSKIDFSTFLVK